MRILAILSEDQNLLNAFKNNEDIHLKTAEFIFQTPFNSPLIRGKTSEASKGVKITAEQRKIAKAVNF
jgi:DNA polymerase-1